ncbi:hypothetical protein UCRPC4_g03199 [Phaeomoniella chlamydospora]|uniref:Uncharacterized protein n=1 Tax=Phaeomoniella chlamydospora TaxID=158046 RepID=A0A0G2EKI8_PHACM|nr:hypothetical protein UCRPC4_g03199 [Phaeomoniella chlamydospora]
MTTRTELEQRWTSLSPGHTDLKSVNKYVALEYIEAEEVERELLCKECDEIVFFDGKRELWTTKGSGKMNLPAHILATVYKGYYLVNPL